MPADLSQSPVGSVVAVRGTDHRFQTDYELEAFVPDPLPREVGLSGDVWMAVSQAMAALGKLDTAASMLGHPQLATRAATRREAVGTSALEGTFANMRELWAAETVDDPDDPSIPPNVREVLNYVRAAEEAYAWIGEGRPITAALLSNLQARIVSGTDSDGPEAGALRGRQVFIGARNRPIAEAYFIPPPPGDQMKARIDDWLAWVNDESLRDSMQLLARVALAHYQFEAIHPYTDGNGRLGRLVMALQILADGALSVPALSVSDWINEHGAEYRDHLMQLSISGDWNPWVEFVAEAVAASADGACQRIMGLLELREEFTETARAALPKGRLAVEMAEDLIALPIMTVAAAEARHGRSNQANRNAIRRLCEIGLLEPLIDSGYGRLYWNRRVIEVMES